MGRDVWIGILAGAEEEAVASVPEGAAGLRLKLKLNPSSYV
jgi:hypothetical protein